MMIPKAVLLPAMAPASNLVPELAALAEGVDCIFTGSLTYTWWADYTTEVLRLQSRAAM